MPECSCPALSPQGGDDHSVNFNTDMMNQGEGSILCFDELVFTGWNFRHLLRGDQETRAAVSSDFREDVLRNLNLPLPEENRCPSKVIMYGRGDRHNRKMLNIKEVAQHINTTTTMTAEVGKKTGEGGK